MLRLGLFASHEGSNAQAIMDACADGTINGVVAVVISNNSGSRALERAKAAGIPALHLSTKTHPLPGALDDAITEALAEHQVDFVALAGYMKRLGPKTIAAYRDRIVNVHPSLLPAHGGAGMYGDRVHQAVLDSGDPETGVTVHIVDEDYDNGPTLAQTRVPVLEGDSVDSLRNRVREQERPLYVTTLARIADGATSV